MKMRLRSGSEQPIIYSLFVNIIRLSKKCVKQNLIINRMTTTLGISRKIFILTKLKKNTWQKMIFCKSNFGCRISGSRKSKFVQDLSPQWVCLVETKTSLPALPRVYLKDIKAAWRIISCDLACLVGLVFRLYLWTAPLFRYYRLLAFKTSIKRTIDIY